MFCFILFSCAEQFMVILDKNNTPLKSKKRFETSRERILYDVIQMHIEKYQTARTYQELYRTIYAFIKSHEEEGRPKPSVLDIKNYYIKRLMGQYMITGSAARMQDLAANFDNDLVKHWDILCTFECDDIFQSLCVKFADYDQDHYVINKSYSVITQNFAATLYEMVLLEIKYGNWRLQQIKQFTDIIGGEDPHIKQLINLIFEEDEPSAIDFDFELNGVYKTILSSIGADKWIDNVTIKQLTRICAVYTNAEVLQMIESSNKFVVPLSDNIGLDDFLCKYTNLYHMRCLSYDLAAKMKIIEPRILHRDPTRYEYFYNAEGEYPTNFEEWKENAIIYEEKIRCVGEYIDKWINIPETPYEHQLEYFKYQGYRKHCNKL